MEDSVQKWIADQGSRDDELPRSENGHTSDESCWINKQEIHRQTTILASIDNRMMQRRILGLGLSDDSRQDMPHPSQLWLAFDDFPGLQL